MSVLVLEDTLLAEDKEKVDCTAKYMNDDSPYEILAEHQHYVFSKLLLYQIQYLRYVAPS